MSRRVTRAQLLAGALLGLLGFSLVVQVRQTRSELSSLSQSELVRLLDDVTRRSERLDADARDLQDTAAQLRSGNDRAAAAERAARERLDVLGILAGTVPAQGPGIVLEIDDPRSGVSSAQLLDTVQELRDAGAEALQVGPVRVVAGTAFTDGPGGEVVVDGTTLRAPYVFTAIGDAQTLRTALDIPGGVLEALRQTGARGTVRAGDDLIIEALHRVGRPRYVTGAGPP